MARVGRTGVRGATPGGPRPFRIEHWEDDGGAHCLVMARAPTDVVALSLSHAGGAWVEGRGLLPAGDMRAPREAVLAALDMRAAGREAAARFGLPHPRAEMTRIVHAAVCGDLGGAPAARSAYPLSASLSAQRPDRAAGLGYEGLSPAPERPYPACRAAPGPRTATVDELPAEAFGVGMPHGSPDAFVALLAPARAFLMARLSPEAGAVLPLRHWSPEAESWYAAAGTAGARRRQAGALYPALAPMIAFAPSVRDAVDAGRPFEAELLATLRGCLPKGGASPGAGLLRRLRSFPGDVSFGTIVETVDVARHLPLDWLPTSVGGWRAFLEDARGMERFSRHCGIALPVLVRDRRMRWSVPAGADPSAAGDWLHRLEEAADMARRAAQTLVEPLLGAGPDPRLVRLSGRLLFGGMSSSGVIARSRRWHGDLPRFEEAVPSVAESCSWPAIFAPFEAAHGLRIVALTDPGQLRDEGARYRDQGGAAGLDHCAGGYARDCYEGATHVASVRRTLPAGGYERLSTAEFVHGAEGLRLRQHRGRRNAAPPAEAEAAIVELCAAVASGAHPTNADACKRRSGDGFGKGIDRTTRPMREASLRAWAPYLPRHAPRDDLDAMEAWLAARAAEPR